MSRSGNSKCQCGSPHSAPALNLCNSPLGSNFNGFGLLNASIKSWPSLLYFSPKGEYIQLATVVTVAES